MVKKYCKTWAKVSNSIKKEFDSEPVSNGKYLKTKAKSYGDKISTSFQDNRISKEVLIAFFCQ